MKERLIWFSRSAAYSTCHCIGSREPLKRKALGLKPLTLVFLGHKGTLDHFASKSMLQTSVPSSVQFVDV